MSTTPKPKEFRDLSLAPVAVAVDDNLKRLRELPLDRIEFQLQLETDVPPYLDDRAERIVRVMRQALRDVELHGWDAFVTDDASAIRLAGGSVTLDLALGTSVMAYIDEPVAQLA